MNPCGKSGDHLPEQGEDHVTDLLILLRLGVDHGHRDQPFLEEY